MELDAVKRLIKNYAPGHADFVKRADMAERYYRNETDILYRKKEGSEEESGENPLRNADNRIPRNFHGLIVNQKASYAFTVPPVFDIGSKAANDRLTKILGDEFCLSCQELCISAANATVGWLHYWDRGDGFEWAVVDSRQIQPIFDRGLKKKLLGVLRTYEDVDDDTGEYYTIYEYWTEKECQAFRRRTAATIDEGLMFYDMFFDPTGSEPVWWYEHGMGKVPFIPFWNNNIHENDLKNIKPLIDIYDKVFSGFINDLDDVQELIFIISGYGGTDLNTFLSDLKQYKTIKVDADEANSGVSTLSIEIPIEARNSILQATRKAIFEQGEGFDPQPENFGNQSGEALKFMYSLLEMKVGRMETQFRPAFAAFVRAICEYENIPCKYVTQTWTRNRIKSDTEQAQICRDSVGIISKLTILKHHPFVENAEAELKQIEKEEKEAAEKADPYSIAFGKPGDDGQSGGEDEE